jgi:hypothetical protein
MIKQGAVYNAEIIIPGLIFDPEYLDIMQRVLGSAIYPRTFVQFHDLAIFLMLDLNCVNARG